MFFLGVSIFCPSSNFWHFKVFWDNLSFLLLPHMAITSFYSPSHYRMRKKIEQDSFEPDRQFWRDDKGELGLQWDVGFKTAGCQKNIPFDFLHIFHLMFEVFHFIFDDLCLQRWTKNRGLLCCGCSNRVSTFPSLTINATMVKSSFNLT